MLKNKLAALSARERIELYNEIVDHQTWPGPDRFYCMDDIEDAFSQRDILEVISLVQNSEHFDLHDDFIWVGESEVATFNAAQINDWISVDTLADMIKSDDEIGNLLADRYNLY